MLTAHTNTGAAARGGGMSGNADPIGVRVLVLEEAPQALEMVGQTLRSRGAIVSSKDDRQQAELAALETLYDLPIVDAAFAGGGGLAFVRWLRRCEAAPCRRAPVLALPGRPSLSLVAQSRDAGANFFLAKPLAAKSLLDRVAWLRRDKRTFVDAGEGYCGPDRRFKCMGPPPGSSGRRASDCKDPLGEAVQPNLSHTEIATLVKPQRAEL